MKPEFHPNKTTLQWFNEDFERIRQHTDILECTLRPGEVRYDSRDLFLYYEDVGEIFSWF